MVKLGNQPIKNGGQGLPGYTWLYFCDIVVVIPFHLEGPDLPPVDSLQKSKKKSQGFRYLMWRNPVPYNVGLF